jgi:hypothetical protein
VANIGGDLEFKLNGKECPIWFSNLKKYVLEKTK